MNGKKKEVIYKSLPKTLYNSSSFSHP